MSKNKFVIGAAIGALAGVVAGVLTAPQSGKETREDLRQKANELKEETARRVESMGEVKKPGDSLIERVKRFF